jgi:hypothetical protein
MIASGLSAINWATLPSRKLAQASPKLRPSSRRLKQSWRGIFRSLRVANQRLNGPNPSLNDAIQSLQESKLKRFGYISTKIVAASKTVAFGVAQAFQPAGSGDFPVASSNPANTGLESPVNPQTGMSALHFRSSNHQPTLKNA